MIAVDTNLLVYAHRGDAPMHARAKECVRRLAEGAVSWGIPVSCLHEFLAVVTNPKIFKPASSVEQALAQVEAWIASPRVTLLHSGERHWSTLADLARKGRLAGGQFHDARIAAICIEHGVSVLWSADRDFGRFRTLETVNPLV